MEPCGTVVTSTLAVFLILHLGLIPVMAQQNELQIGIAGQEVNLSCRGIPQDSGVIWKYNRVVIRLIDDLKPLKGKATMADRSEINADSKHLKVLDLRLSDAGTYTCEYGSHRVSISLHVFQLTISLDGHFLPNEVPELTLMQNSCHIIPNLNITLFDSNNKIVRPEVLRDKSPQKYTLKLKQLKTTDSGRWICHILSDSPLINKNISFEVKVLGFQNPDFERKYATVDSSVILSWHLNIQKINWKNGLTGQLYWKKQETETIHELLDFNATAQGRLHDTQKSRHFQFEITERQFRSTIEVKLPTVHFDHAGQYQCQLAYKGRNTQRKIELVVMKVSANHVGPLPRGAQITLTCQVSSPLPSNAHLWWEHVNGTEKDIKKSKPHEVKVEVNVSAAGLWNCHLMEDNVRKISLNYLVEEAPVWIRYAVTGTSIGGSVLVFGLAFISGITWHRRRQRAKRMAQARQYLLENKTCQCQRRLKK